MKVYAVFKTHFDIGFTGLAREVIEKYSTSMLDNVLDACEKTQVFGEKQQFVWTMSSWPLYISLLNASPERLLRAEKLIKRRQLVCHALPYTLHCELLTQEEFNEGFKYARAISEKYNVPMPISAKMTDVPGHSSGIIEVLVNNGVKFLHLGSNPAVKQPKVPLLFWWEDKKGNRLLTMYNHGYGSQILPPEGWEYPVWLSMQMTNDNKGPQSSSIIQKLKSQLEPEHEFIVSSMDEFAEEILKCDLSKLPVIKGDIGDTWIHGLGTYPKEVSYLKRARACFDNMKMAGVLDKDKYQAEINEYYDNLLLFAEHTWGMSLPNTLSYYRVYDQETFVSERKNNPKSIKLEESWEEQRERAENCKNIIDKLAKECNFTAPLEDDEAKTDNGWSIEEKGGKLVLTSPKGTEITVDYRYQIAGYDKIHNYMANYIVMAYDWAVCDMGRQGYPYDLFSKEYEPKSIEVVKANDGRKVRYIPQTDEYGYGNALAEISARKYGKGILVSVDIKDKQASPIVESGDVYFNTNIKDPEYFVHRMGAEVDVANDVVEDANQVLYGVEKYARINQLKISPFDSALVAFGECATLYKVNTGKFVAPKEPTFVFNLFNNMWGTNFPQWHEGNFHFEFFIEEE